MELTPSQSRYSQRIAQALTERPGTPIIVEGVKGVGKKTIIYEAAKVLDQGTPDDQLIEVIHWDYQQPKAIHERLVELRRKKVVLLTEPGIDTNAADTLILRNRQNELLNEGSPSLHIRVATLPPDEEEKMRDLRDFVNESYLRAHGLGIPGQINDVQKLQDLDRIRFSRLLTLAKVVQILKAGNVHILNSDSLEQLSLLLGRPLTIDQRHFLEVAFESLDLPVARELFHFLSNQEESFRFPIHPQTLEKYQEIFTQRKCIHIIIAIPELPADFFSDVTDEHSTSDNKRKFSVFRGKASTASIRDVQGLASVGDRHAIHLLKRWRSQGAESAYPATDSAYLVEMRGGAPNYMVEGASHAYILEALLQRKHIPYLIYYEGLKQAGNFRVTPEGIHPVKFSINQH